MTTQPRSVEQSLLDMEVRMRLPENRRSERMTPFLAEEFVEFASSGRTWTKAETLAAVQGQAPVATSSSDFKVQMLAPTVALVTYRVRRESEPVLETLRSSIWREHDGRWQIVFHQGTVIP